MNAARLADRKALLGTLFASSGAIMLTAGDEFGRTQQGNNNAYAQDNAISWIDWKTRDLKLETHAFALAEWRAALAGAFEVFPENGQWLRLDGQAMTVADWESDATPGFQWVGPDYRVRVDREARTVTVSGP